MMMRASLAAVTSFLIAVPSVAQDATQPTSVPEAEKKICRQIVPTGTIMAKRFCLTKSEWAKLSDINGRHAQMALDRRNGSLDKRTMGEIP
jgi:predicted transglutaminase-like cysteine proteinase